MARGGRCDSARQTGGRRWRAVRRLCGCCRLGVVTGSGRAGGWAQVRAEDQPPMDIGMMGKAMQMEMRVVVWDTRDTAPKDGCAFARPRLCVGRDTRSTALTGSDTRPCVGCDTAYEDGCVGVALDVIEPGPACEQLPEHGTDCSFGETRWKERKWAA